MRRFIPKQVSWPKRILNEYRFWLENKTEAQKLRWRKAGQIFKLIMAFHAGWFGLSTASEINNRYGNFSKKVAVLSSNEINHLDRAMMALAAPIIGTFDLSGGSYVHRYWLTLPINYYFNKNGYQVDWYAKAGRVEFDQVMNDPRYQAVTLIGHGNDHSWGTVNLPNTDFNKLKEFGRMNLPQKEIIIKLTCGSNARPLEISAEEKEKYGALFAYQYRFGNIANFKTFLSYQGLIPQHVLFLDALSGFPQLSQESGFRGDLTTVLNQTSQLKFLDEKVSLYEIENVQKTIVQLRQKNNDMIVTFLHALNLTEDYLSKTKKQVSQEQLSLIKELESKNKSTRKYIIDSIAKLPSRNQYYFLDFAGFDKNNLNINLIDFVKKNPDYLNLFNHYFDENIAKENVMPNFKLLFKGIIEKLNTLNLSTPRMKDFLKEFTQKSTAAAKNRESILLNIFDKDLDLKDIRVAKQYQISKNYFYTTLNDKKTAEEKFNYLMGYLFSKPTKNNKLAKEIEPLLTKLFINKFREQNNKKTQKQSVDLDTLNYLTYLNDSRYLKTKLNLEPPFLKELDLKVIPLFQINQNKIDAFVSHSAEILLMKKTALTDLALDQKKETIDRIENLFIQSFFNRVGTLKQNPDVRSAYSFFKFYIEYFKDQLDPQKFQKLHQQILSGQSVVPKEIVELYLDDTLKDQGYGALRRWIIKKTNYRI